MNLHCKTIILFLLVFTFGHVDIYAQRDSSVQIAGKVLDAKNSLPIPNVIILLYSGENEQDGKLIGYTTSNSDGIFSIETNDKPTFVIAKLVGYKDYSFFLKDSEEQITISLEENIENLPEVTIVAPPIRQSGDTITYRASTFITPNTYSAEDLMKRLPGITVDSNGTIEYLGESIQGVYIEGLDLVSKSYQTATRIIKAEDISAIDVMERFQPKSVLKGLKEGEGAMINIRLKDSAKLKPSGEVTIGAGTKNEENEVHQLGGNLLLVNNKTQMIGSIAWDRTASDLIGSHISQASIPSTSALDLVENRATSQGDKNYRLSDNLLTTTLNQIFVLKDNHTAKYNVNYNHQNFSTSSGSNSRLANGNSFVSYNQSKYNTSTTRLATLYANITNNSSNRYFENTSKLEGTISSNISDISRNNMPIQERVSLGEIRFENTTDLIRKEGSRLFSISGDIIYRKLPKATNEVPSGEYFYYQRISGQEFSAKTMFSYGWGLGDYLSVFGNIDFQGHLQEAEVSFENDQPESMVKGGKIFITTSPTLDYNKSNFRWKVSFPIEFLYYNYRYLDYADISRYSNSNKVRLGGVLNMSYRPTPQWYMSWNSRYSNTDNSTLSDYMLVSIHTSFENIITRKVLLHPVRKAMSTMFSVEYKNPIKGFFARINGLGMRTISNVITDSSLHNTTKEGNMSRGEHKRTMYSGQLFLSKFLTDFKSVISFSTDYNYSDNPILISGRRSEVNMHSLASTIELNSAPCHWLDLSSRISWSQSVNVSEFGKTKINEWRLFGSVIIGLGEKFNIGIQNKTNIVTHLESNYKYPVFSLLDAFATYRYKRYRVEVRCNNLLNNEALFIYRSIDADQHHSYSMLRPRQIVVSAFIKY